MQENKKQTKTLVSGILNLVNAFLCLAITVAYFIVLNADILGKTGDNSETLGYAVTLIIFVPLAIIALVPIIIDNVYKVVFSIILIGGAVKRKTDETYKVRKGFFTASLVLKIISTIALALEAMFTTIVISAGGLTGLSLVFMFTIIAIMLLQIALIFIENASKKEISL